MKVAGYIRVSTDDQRLGMDAQRAQLLQMAAHHNLPEPTFYVDHGVSGGTPHYERPGFQALLHDKPTHVLCTKRDRLARDVLHALFLEKELLKHSIHLITSDAPSADDPSSKLMRTIIDAFAEYERALISHRTKQALQQAKKLGKKLGGCKKPFGTLPGEGDVLHLVESNKSLAPRHLASILNAAGHKTRKGLPYTPENVKDLRRR